MSTCKENENKIEMGVKDHNFFLFPEKFGITHRTIKKRRRLNFAYGQKVSGEWIGRKGFGYQGLCSVSDFILLNKFRELDGSGCVNTSESSGPI